MRDQSAQGMMVVERGDGLEMHLAKGMRAVTHNGDLHAGRRSFQLAYEVAERSGDVSAMAAAALGTGGVWVHEHRTAAGSALLRSRLLRALALVDPDSPLALRLRIRLAAESDYRAGENAAILTLLDEARRGPDPLARTEALSFAHHCLLGPEHVELRLSLAVELIQESFATGQRSDLLMGLLWETVDLFQAGDPHAERHLGELRALLACEDHLAVGFVVCAMDVMLAVRAGRFEDAEKLAQDCAELGTAAGAVDATGWHAAQLAAIRWYQGRLAELSPMLTDLVHSCTLSVVDNSCLAALAAAAAMAGDRLKATSALATLCGRDLADLPRSSSWLVTMNGIVEAAHLLQEADTSERAYRLLSPFANLPMVISLGVACFGSVHHALGVASLTVGEVDRAVVHLQEAVRQNLALAHWPAVLASRSRLAQALTSRGRPEDAAAAQLELTTAAEEAAAWGISSPGRARPVLSMSLTCTRLGRNWCFELGGRSVLVEHSIGMFHLAVLIANPGQEIPAVDLVRGLAALSEAPAAARVSRQPMLDITASREYRRRLEQLRLEIENLESRGEHEKAAQCSVERDRLVAELSRATGIGGRPRPFPDDAERARIAVGKAIRRALARISGVDTMLGEHLRGTVHTGVRCSYQSA